MALPMGSLLSSGLAEDVLRVAVVGRSPWPPSGRRASLAEEGSRANQDLTYDVLELAVAAAPVWRGWSVWYDK
eukprot:11381425-Heterocapsa_arctica.AAC.1